jgi:hypothetical protein
MAAGRHHRRWRPGLAGNRYQVDPALARLRVELVFDRFDLTYIPVCYSI